MQVGPGGIVSHNHIYAMGLVDIKSPCQLRPTMSTKIVSLLGPSTGLRSQLSSHTSSRLHSRALSLFGFLSCASRSPPVGNNLYLVTGVWPKLCFSGGLPLSSKRFFRAFRGSLP